MLAGLRKVAKDPLGALVLYGLVTVIVEVIVGLLLLLIAGQIEMIFPLVTKIVILSSMTVILIIGMILAYCANKKAFNNITQQKEVNNTLANLYPFFDPQGESFLKLFSQAFNENAISENLYLGMSKLSNRFIRIREQFKYEDKPILLSKQRLKPLVEDLYEVIAQTIQAYMEFRNDFNKWDNDPKLWAVVPTHGESKFKNYKEVLASFHSKEQTRSTDDFHVMVKDFEKGVSNFKLFVLMLNPIFVELLDKPIEPSVRQLGEENE